MPIIRAVGVVTFVPLLYHVLINWRRNGIRGTTFLWCLAPLIGWATTYFVMYFLTGDPFTGSKAGDLYRAQGSLLHIFDPILFINNTFSVTSLHAYLGSLIDRIWMIPLVFALVILWRKDKSLFLYSLAMILISAMLPRYASFTRYLCVIFPVFIAYGDFFAHKGKTNYLYATIALLASLQILFIIRYLNNMWVG
jgi:hypothetical protein